MSIKKTWLITGASSGIGYGIALSALEAGHTVIATARNPEVAASNHPEFASKGGQWAKLDVSLPSAQDDVEAIITAEESRQRETKQDSKPPHWVIVNNAGSMRAGLVEDQSEPQINDDLQVALFGTIRVWKASIPTLRKHGTGTLVTMGSIFATAPFPETQLYSAAKAAVSSLADSYAAVLPPLGIASILLEPGLFRTSLADNAIAHDGPLTPAYAARVQGWQSTVASWGENPALMPGDPRKLGQRVVDAVDGTGLGRDLLKSRAAAGQETGYDTLGALRLVLGTDAYTKGLEKLDALRENYTALHDVAASTDHDDVVKG